MSSQDRESSDNCFIDGSTGASSQTSREATNISAANVSSKVVTMSRSYSMTVAMVSMCTSISLQSELFCFPICSDIVALREPTVFDLYQESSLSSIFIDSFMTLQLTRTAWSLTVETTVFNVWRRVSTGQDLTVSWSTASAYPLASIAATTRVSRSILSDLSSKGRIRIFSESTTSRIGKTCRNFCGTWFSDKHWCVLVHNLLEPDQCSFPFTPYRIHSTAKDFQVRSKGLF